MWTRRELKEWAKAALSRNYWKIVLVSALLLLLGCGTGGISFQRTIYHNSTESGVEESSGNRMIVQDIQGNTLVQNNIEMSFWEAFLAGGIAIVIFLVIFLVVFAVVLAVDIFLINPLCVGGSRFMIVSVQDTAQVREIAFAFDHSYKNIVKVMFFRDLYIVLWSLLLIIPGIIKMYEYYMVPYILTEYPDMEYKAALQMSRDMMRGQKWKTFVLGLSFILWHFLGALTFGIVEVLYVQPYCNLTFAALYCRLRSQMFAPQPEPLYGQYNTNGQYDGQYNANVQNGGQYSVNGQYNAYGQYNANGQYGGQYNANGQYGGQYNANGQYGGQYNANVQNGGQYNTDVQNGGQYSVNGQYNAYGQYNGNNQHDADNQYDANGQSGGTDQQQ